MVNIRIKQGITMNKQLFSFILLASASLNFLYASLDSPLTDKALLPDTTLTANNPKEKMLWFRFKDTPISEIIDYLATEKKINILPPQGSNALTSKLTFELPYKVSLDKAWNTLLTILDLSGYTFIPHSTKDKNVKDDRSGISYIVKNDGNVNKESLPIYINCKRDDLPNSYVRIRYIRYLENLQIASGGGGPLQKILTDFLSADAASSLIFEPILNAVIITDRSIMIKTALEIIDALESSTSKQTLKIIPLKYTVAGDIKSLFDQLISGTSSNSSSSGSYGQPAPSTNSSSTGYFEKTTKTIAEPRTNRLILIGKADALDRIEKFIKEYIDIPTELGESVLHIYPLKYLDASTFAQTLTTIVSNSTASSGSSGGGYGSGSGQSTSTSIGSVTQYFNGVIITTEGASSGSSSNGTTGSAGVSQTGNRLIIAATKNDWINLKKLIEELDTAQPQVAIKCLIVDLSSTGAKALGSQIRNRKDMVSGTLTAQAGNLVGITTSSPNLTDTITNPNGPTLAGNLMNGLNSSGNIATALSSSGNQPTIVTFTDPTSTIPNDIWWIARILNNAQDNQILSQPFGFGTNNQQIVFSSTETRILPGQAAAQQGTVVVNNPSVQAAITLTLTPRISKNNTMNIQITINVNQWIGNNNNQNNRAITTNINMKSGEICFLSGLGKRETDIQKNETPLLCQIPLLRTLFSDTSTTKVTTDLCIFLQAEIIQPRHDFDPYTREKFTETVESLFASENFENLRDPITRWFFGDTSTMDEQWRGFKDRPIKAHTNKEDTNEFQLKENNTANTPPSLTPPYTAPIVQKKQSATKNDPETSQQKKAENKTNNQISNQTEEEKAAAEKIKKLFSEQQKKGGDLAIATSPDFVEILNTEIKHAGEVTAEENFKGSYPNFKGRNDSLEELENTIAKKLDEDYNDPSNPFGPHTAIENSQQ